MIWRTLENYGADFEKVSGLDRGIAAQCIKEIKETFNAHALKPDQRHSEEEKQSALNGRTKALRALKDHYKI